MHSTARAACSSAARERALSILHPVHLLEPEVFAHYMWPLSPSWQRADAGQGIRRKAQSFLARLRREGLVESRATESGGEGYVVTPEGMRLTTGW